MVTRELERAKGRCVSTGKVEHAGGGGAGGQAPARPVGALTFGRNGGGGRCERAMAPTVPGGGNGGLGSPPGTPALSVGIIIVVEEGAVPCLATPPAAASFAAAFSAAVAFSAALAVSRLAARSASLARMASRALAASFRPSHDVVGSLRSQYIPSYRSATAFIRRK